ncbi:MAG: polyphenol oxidase family protein [Treponema sp.]|nr:polyphenol oxidase family protein [Treponema sp.]
MKRISIASAVSDQQDKYVFLPFYSAGRPFADNAPVWGMTLRKAGSMRFRWSETNCVRREMLSGIVHRSSGRTLTPVQLELIHSKTVYDVSSFSDTFGLQGDGIITGHAELLPVVTVADCMPLFLYDPVTGVFGAVHSGWKGTGIIGEAVRTAEKNYGAVPGNICIAIGPHIRSCCYVVDEGRAEYFRRNFCGDCVIPFGPEDDGDEARSWNSAGGKLYRLSLEKANLAVLDSAGIRDENITVAADCTCCCSLFGSFRRETSGIPEDDKWRRFTVQAAFCGHLSS